MLNIIFAVPEFTEIHWQTFHSASTGAFANPNSTISGRTADLLVGFDLEGFKGAGGTVQWLSERSVLHCRAKPS